MSQGPESNFWKSIRQNLPPKTFATRIENKHGGGVPDVHLLWDGIPIWIELKVSKGNAVKVSPHQVAWHMAYHARGGLSFYLVKRYKERDLVLFGGDQGVALASGGISEAQGTIYKSPAALFLALRPVLLDKLACSLRPAP